MEILLFRNDVLYSTIVDIIYKCITHKGRRGPGRMVLFLYLPMKLLYHPMFRSSTKWQLYREVRFVGRVRHKCKRSLPDTGIIVFAKWNRQNNIILTLS